MPTNENGVLVFAPDEKMPPIEKGVLISTFGFILSADGETTKIVLATEEDYRKSEAKRLGISPSKVVLKGNCRSQIDHDTGEVKCVGGCAGVLRCTRMKDGDYLRCDCH